MRRLRLFLAVLSTTTFLFGQEPTVPQLFQQAKEAFNRGAFSESLSVFEEIDRKTEAPGMERERAKLLPVLAFYRGANLAALGEKAASIKEFDRYLAFVPSATLDARNFPRKVTEAFDAARAARFGSREDMNAVYVRFQASGKPEPVTEQWGESAVRYLLSKDEAAAWKRRATDRERAAFVAEFWKKRDPTEGTEENELQAEIERRMQFADAVFTTKAKLGRETDRGLVFVVMGPPSHAAVASLRSELDGIETLRGATGHVSLQSDLSHGSREAWYYKGDRIPEGMKYQEIRFDFITREGYGSGILQREARQLQALDQAAGMVNEKRRPLP